MATCFCSFSSLTLILSSVLFILISSKTNALGATEDQISAFNNAVTGGKKEAFIFTVDTTKGTDPTRDREFKLYAGSANGINANYNIYCDIASSTTPTATNQTGDYVCNYSASGVYTIAVTGVYPFMSVRDEKLISVDQWGTNKWQNMSWMFFGASNFNKIPDPNIEIPDTSQVTDMSYMFQAASAFNQPIGNWNTSKVTDMSWMFFGASSFNQPIGNWDTSKVRDMRGMFAGIQDSIDDINNLAGLNTTDQEEVEEVINQFLAENNLENAPRHNSFNQDISSWNLSNLKNSDEEGTLGRGMLSYSGMSRDNYEKALNAWAARASTPENIFLGAKSLTYCDTAGRDALIAKGWFIEGDTHSCDTPKPAPTATNTSANQTNSGQSAAKNAAEIKTKSQSQTGAKDNQTLAETGFNIWPVIAAFASILLGGAVVMRKTYTRK